MTPLNGGSSLTGGAGAGSAAEMKRGEWHPIIIRATNESNGHVTSLGHRIVVSLSLLVTASSSSSSFFSTSSSDGVGTSFTPIGGQSLVALAETIPASSEENHQQRQQQQQQKTKGKQKDSHHSSSQIGGGSAAVVTLDERGHFRGYVKILPTCNRLHYSSNGDAGSSSSSRHSPSCFHRISQPLFLRFEAKASSLPPAFSTKKTTPQPPKASSSRSPSNLPVSPPLSSPSSSPPSSPPVILGPFTVTSQGQSTTTAPSSSSSSSAAAAAAAFPLSLSPVPPQGGGSPMMHRIYDLSCARLYLTEQEVMDGFGHVIWDAAFLLVKHLEQLGTRSLRGKRCLEVGSGVGLVGICAAALGAKVVLTDMPSALHLTQLNVDRSQPLVRQQGGEISVAPLLWGTPVNHLGAPLILCSLQTWSTTTTSLRPSSPPWCHFALETPISFSLPESVMAATSPSS